MLIIVCFVLASGNGAGTVNVAFNKSVDICSFTGNASGIVDGNILSLAQTITTLCPEGEIKITLGGNYFINYALVFRGQAEEDGAVQIGSNFIIQDDRDEGPDCGMYLTVDDAVSGQGLRINCEFHHIPQSQLHVKFENKPFHVAEVEAHTLASGVPGEGVMVYRGCFKNFPDSTQTPFSNIQACRQFCVSGYNIYMAIKANATCLCGGIRGQETQEDDCHLNCANSNKKCGGFEASAVYLVQVQLPYYKECQEGDNPVEEASDVMTVAMCLQKCDGSFYALLNNGNQCACSNVTIGNTKFHFESKCNVTCKGDPKSYCGGENSWSVYATCYSKTLGAVKCSELFQCSRNSWNKYGFCETSCKRGYAGEHCIERGLDSKHESTLSCNESDPCQNVSNSYCKFNIKSNTFLCVCLHGFWKIKGEVCEDIDECQYDPCDNTTSSCANVLGSYLCPCRPGYYQLTDLICQGNATDDLNYTNNVMLYLFIFFIHIAFFVIFCSMGRKIEKTTFSGSEMSSRTSEARPAVVRPPIARPPSARPASTRRKSSIIRAISKRTAFRE